MKTAPLWRRVKQVGLALAGLNAVLWLASGFFFIASIKPVLAPPGVNTGLGANTTDAEGFALGGGMVGFFGQKFVLNGNSPGWSASAGRFRFFTRFSAHTLPDRTYEYACPIGAFIPLFAAVGGLGLFMERRRTPIESPGACPACGYPRADLATQAPCPECGSARPANPILHDPRPRNPDARRRRTPLAPRPQPACTAWRS